MKTRLVRIGNSQGIRIPKPFLEQCRLADEVDLSVVDNAIVIRPSGAPREGWDASFAGMSAAGDDALLDPDVSLTPEWDEDEWQW